MKFKSRCLLIASAGIGIGLFGWLTERFIHGFEDTVYSSEYSEPKFLSLTNGMTAKDVEAALGPPLAKTSMGDEENKEIWKYSISPSDGDYWRRWVFIKDGKIDRIDCEFYND